MSLTANRMGLIKSLLMMLTIFADMETMLTHHLLAPLVCVATSNALLALDHSQQPIDSNNKTNHTIILNFKIYIYITFKII